MRFLLPLVVVCTLPSVPLRADKFDITLTGDPRSPGSPSGSGTLTTDETCTMAMNQTFIQCMPGSGLLSAAINIGPDSGPDAFDLSDDSILPGDTPTFTLTINDLFDAYFVGEINSETGDFLFMDDPFSFSWVFNQAGTVFTGTYSITPAAAVPEPSYLFVLLAIVALFGLHWRRQRHHA